MAVRRTAIASRTIAHILSSSYSSVSHAQASAFLLRKRPVASLVSHAAFQPGVISPFPSLSTHRLTATRSYLSSPGDGDWTPLKVDNFGTLMAESYHRLQKSSVSPCGDKRHWFVKSANNAYGYATEQELFDYYIRTLAAVVGSEVEAKKRIYLVSCAMPFGFAAEFDESTKKELDGPAIYFARVLEDFYYGTRNKDPSVQPAVRFNPFNWNHRLDNIYSYFYLSKRNSEWDSDHWLIHLKDPDSGPVKNYLALQFAIKLLAEVVGSEEEAKPKIYIMWMGSPCGFAAQVDEETANKLKGLPDVVNVLPDYSFDTMNEYGEALVIYPLHHGSKFSYQHLPSEYNSEDWAGSVEEHSCGRGGSADLDWKFGLTLSSYFRTVPTLGFNRKFFITTEMPGGLFAPMLRIINLAIQTLPVAVGGFMGLKSSVAERNFTKGSSIARFTLNNQNDRLGDIYSYHHLSGCKREWNLDHWIVNINQPGGEFGTEQQILDFCVRMLAELLGSEEVAKQKIYIVWSKFPFGFGAEIDEETSNKLKCLPNVLNLLPDYAFDVKSKDHGALVISSSTCLSPNRDQEYAYTNLFKLCDSSDEDSEELLSSDPDEEDLDTSKYPYGESRERSLSAFFKFYKNYGS